MSSINKRVLVFNLSMYATGFLICPANVTGILGIIVVCFVLSILSQYFANHYRIRGVLEQKEIIVCLILSAFISSNLLYSFINRWMPSSKLKHLTALIHVSHKLFIVAFGVALALGTVFFCFELLQFCIPRVRCTFDTQESLYTRTSSSVIADQGTPISHHILIAICAAGFITICSRSSPLYPFNNWDDANCFFTVGKSMFNGLVPYRDLIEQKGPLLYFLYGLTWFISNDSFFGGYLLEIIAAYFYLLSSLRIIQLFIKDDVIFLVPIIALITYTSTAFEQGGSSEELCLPLLSASLLIMLRDMYGRRTGKVEMLVFGFLAGCVFWIKFSLIGLYLGWLLWVVFDLTVRGERKEILKKISLIGCGVIISTIPWILYFGINNAIRDWLVVYLYDNIFLYSQASNDTNAITSIPVLGNLAAGLRSFFLFNAGAFIILAIGFSFLFLYGKKRVSKMLFASIIGIFVLIYVGGRNYRYYSLILDIFLAPIFALLYCMLCKIKAPGNIKARRFITFASLVICLCCSFLTPNRYFMSMSKEDLAQYRFKEIMLSESKNITMLNFGFLDGGFYTVTGIYPNCKAFCGLNVPLDELGERQEYYAKNGLCDYIVTRSALGADDNQDFELYECIAECDSDYSWWMMTYRLYRLKR